MGSEPVTDDFSNQAPSGESLLPGDLQTLPAIAGLPVVNVLPQLDQALAEQKRALVQAPPGAGKTTLVPLALKDRPWLGGKKIVMLEPRRLAARACAVHMAALLEETPGQTVGFQVRMDRCIGPSTRIEVITEGILTRMIQSDPALEGVGLLIFDEFHERHIHGDLGLALSLETAEVFNPDLRILVMSATMDTRALSKIMGGAPVVESQGRTWPVTTHYMDTATGAGIPGGRLENPFGRRFPGRPGDKAAQIMGPCFATVVKALETDPGDILVFLPGAAQIRGMAQALQDRFTADTTICIHPLYGSLSPAAQRAAIAPSNKGRRKIVLATTIAETSLTIDGVRVVVDAGLARAPRFSPGRSMTRLETIAVSKASADQRRGRAGRTAAGVCYRLWSRHVHQGLMPFNRPEILNADLAFLVLELARWGVSDPDSLCWLDPPPAAAFKAGVELLQQLEALDNEGRITPHGQALTEAGVHPRLAHMIIKAQAMNKGFTACCLAALVEERDIVAAGRAAADPDIGLRLEMLDRLHRTRSDAGADAGIHLNRARQVLERAGHLARQFKVARERLDTTGAGRLLAFAWPERVARQRRTGALSYVTAGGSGVFFRSDNPLSNQEFIVAVHVDGNPKNAAVFLAAAYDAADLETDFASAIKTCDTVGWHPERRAVTAVSQTLYGKLVLNERPLKQPDPEPVKRALMEGIRQTGPSALSWSAAGRAFRHRVMFLKGLDDPGFDGLPDVSDDRLFASLEHWLGPYVDGVTSLGALGQVGLDGALKAMFSWDQLQLVDTHAPTHIVVPSGSKVPLRYGDETGTFDAPVLAVRLQEMFGLEQTPAVARSRVPLTLHLLSPASRPVQITRDLASFWKNTYKDVKKDLMGRYPKHFWPEDPVGATPTARAKPRKK